MTTHSHLKTLAEAATPGPYDFYWGWNFVFAVNPSADGKRTIIADYCHLHLETRTPEQIRNDMAFHAACAPSTILALLAENERLRDRLAKLSAACKALESPDIDWIRPPTEADEQILTEIQHQRILEDADAKGAQ